MPKTRKLPARLDLKSVSGTWYLQHTYQMRDVDRIRLKATTEAAAIDEARKILEKYPDIDEPLVMFISTDGSIIYTVDRRKSLR